MKSLEIVTHCWRYSRMLAWQLSSLVNHHLPCDVHITLTVHHCQNPEDDPGTHEVLDYPWLPKWPAAKDGEIAGAMFTIRRVRWPLPQLWNRNIGRHRSAVKTSADWVWFADCDYYFGLDCLGTLAALDPKEHGRLVFPDPYWICKDHDTGEAYIRQMAQVEPRTIRNADFIEHTCNRAIGGVQIIPGDVCRRYGYAPQNQEPRTDGFGGFDGDIAQRKLLGTPGKKIFLPNLYRLRERRGVVDNILMSPSA